MSPPTSLHVLKSKQETTDELRNALRHQSVVNFMGAPCFEYACRRRFFAWGWWCLELAVVIFLEGGRGVVVRFALSSFFSTQHLFQ